MQGASSAALLPKLSRTVPPTAGKPSIGGPHQLHSAVGGGGVPTVAAWDHTASAMGIVRPVHEREGTAIILRVADSTLP